MLASSKIIGFALTKDYDRARAFYEGKLGLQFVSLDQFALVMKAGESMIRISKVPDFTPIRSTVLGWEVQNIETAVASLKKQGRCLRKISLHSRRRAGHLDGAHRRQGCMVQRPGWKRA